MKFKIAFVILLVSVWVFWPGSGQNWVEIEVNEGQNAHDIARELKDAGAIRLKAPFLLWTKIRRAESRLKIGRYRISKGRAAFWIVDDFIQGRIEKARLVIPEGFASWQIAERLESLKICDGSAFKEVVKNQKLEGFLFPATYELPNGLSAVTVARLLTEQFNARWTPELESRAKEIGWTKLQAVTFASIIEREVRVRDELPEVSALYHNRLRINMKLQADPTVQYALGYWKPRLTYADYHNTKSLYNTYLHYGLPPAPICSPGLDAIKAALWPSQSDALYILATEAGRHSFSSTLREHTNKVNRRNRSRK